MQSFSEVNSAWSVWHLRTVCNYWFSNNRYGNSLFAHCMSMKLFCNRFKSFAELRHLSGWINKMDGYRSMAPLWSYTSLNPFSLFSFFYCCVFHFISVCSSIHLTYSHSSMPSLPFSLPPCYVREMLTWGQDNGTNLCVHLRLSPNRPLQALTQLTFHTAVSTIAAQTRAHVTHDSISQELNKPVYTGR